MACPLISPTADEEDRRSDHVPLAVVTENEVATVTATMETNLRQGDLETEVDGMEGDVTETETEINEALSSGRRSGDEVISTVEEEVRPCDSTGGCAQRRGLWLASESAGDRTGGRAHSPTGMLWVFLLSSLMSCFPIVEDTEFPKERERRRPS